jgi:flavin-dependent dehydrogenase
MSAERYDVAVVGASIGGCTAAQDTEVLRGIEKLASRRAGPLSMLSPRILLRAGIASRRASATGAFASIGSPEKGGGPNLSHMLQGTLEVQGR